jgi:hypothetical protein
MKTRKKKPTNRQPNKAQAQSNHQFPLYVKRDLVRAMLEPAWTGDTKAYLTLLHQCLKEATSVLLARDGAVS